jgi:chromosome segregation ATPase
LSFDVETIKQDIDFKRENILELKSELENRKNDLETMKGDIDLRNKIINEIKNQMIENQQKFTEKNILLNELGDIKLKINENKSALEVVEGELAKRKSELQVIAPIQQETTEPMIDDITTSDEIEKNIDVLDETIKTKKLDFQAELNED